MGEKNKQHQIPKLYIKHFAREDKMISVLVCKDNEQIIFIANAPYKNQCQNSNYYGKDKMWENRLELNERNVAPILHRFVNGEDYYLKSNEKFTLYEYISLQLARVPMRIDVNLNQQAHVILQMMQMEFYLNNREIIKEKDYMQLLYSCRETIRQDTINIVLKIGEEILEDILDLDYFVIKYDTNNSLIFCDNPAIVYNPFLGFNTGLGCAGVLIILPICSNKVLVLFDSKIYKFPKRNIIKNSKEVEVLNIFQIICRTEKILFQNVNDRDNLDKLMRKYQRYRVAYIESSKPQVYGPLNNRFIVSPSPYISFKYGFSFADMRAEAKHLKYIDTILMRQKDNTGYERVFKPEKCNLLFNQITDAAVRKQALRDYQKFVEKYWSDLE